MINIGIVGLQGMGRARIQAISNISTAKVSMICTRNPVLLKDTSRQYEISNVSTEWKDLVDNPLIDAVCVCTPNNLHLEMAQRAIKKGKHVLVEYPLAGTMEEITTLTRLSLEAGVVLHEGLTTRYEPHHLKVKELLPTLGDPLEVHGSMRWPTMWKWARNEKIMGSFFALANFHLVDQWIDIYGNPAWVHASLWKRKQQDDLIMVNGSMFFGYESGLSAYVSYSMGVPNQKTFMEFRLVHAEGMVEFRDETLYVTRRDGVSEVIPVQENKDSSIQSDTMQFIHEIEKGELALPPEQIAATTKLCLLAQQSCEHN